MTERHLLGPESLCRRANLRKEVRYPAEDSANRAAAEMNTKPFCAQWHVGRKMSLEELEAASS